MRFLRHNSGVQWQKNGPEDRLRPGARCAIGTPSAWIFLVRLHACRAGLRFSRQGELYPGEGPDTTNGRWPGGDAVRVQEASGQDRGRDSGCIPGSDMAQCDAAGVNGSNRILFHGAPRLRMMPNGCLGSPVLVLLFGLDRGFLMDVGPTRAT